MYIPDIIPVSYQDEIERIINANDFPWFYTHDISPGSLVDDRITEASAICHTLYSTERGINSDYFHSFRPILYFLEEKTGITCARFLRIRIRRSFPVPGHSLTKYNRPHIDLPEIIPFTTLVYYTEDSDGDTVLFKEEYYPGLDPDKVDVCSLTETDRFVPKKGAGLVFNGYRYHAGNNPVNFKKRTIINFDFVEREK